MPCKCAFVYVIKYFMKVYVDVDLVFNKCSLLNMRVRLKISQNKIVLLIRTT